MASLDMIVVKTDFVIEVAKILAEGLDIRIRPVPYPGTETVDIEIAISKFDGLRTREASYRVRAADVCTFGADSAWTRALIYCREKFLK